MAFHDSTEAKDSSFGETRTTEPSGVEHYYYHPHDRRIGKGLTKFAVLCLDGIMIATSLRVVYAPGLEVLEVSFVMRLRLAILVSLTKLHLARSGPGKAASG